MYYKRSMKMRITSQGMLIILQNKLRGMFSNTSPIMHTPSMVTLHRNASVDEAVSKNKISKQTTVKKIHIHLTSFSCTLQPDLLFCTVSLFRGHDMKCYVTVQKTNHCSSCTYSVSIIIFDQTLPF